MYVRERTVKVFTFKRRSQQNLARLRRSMSTLMTEQRREEERGRGGELEKERGVEWERGMEGKRRKDRGERNRGEGDWGRGKGDSKGAERTEI